MRWLFIMFVSPAAYAAIAAPAACKRAIHKGERESFGQGVTSVPARLMRSVRTPGADEKGETSCGPFCSLFLIGLLGVLLEIEGAWGGGWGTVPDELKLARPGDEMIPTYGLVDDTCPVQFRRRPTQCGRGSFQIGDTF